MNVNKREFDTLLEKLMKNLINHIDEEEVISIFLQHADKSVTTYPNLNRRSILLSLKR